jgi:hypothetical protein
LIVKFTNTLMMTIHKIWLIAILFSMSATGQGRRSIPNATPEQSAAITNINAALAPQTQRLAAVRSALIAASFVQPRNDAAIRAHVEDIGATELELAKARAAAFAELQSSVNKLSADQIDAFAASGDAGRGGAGYRTSMPHVTSKQASTLLDMSAVLQTQAQRLNAARAEVTLTALAAVPNAVAILSKIDAVKTAELALAEARADAFATMQSTPDHLDSEQVAWLVAAGGSYTTGFTEPEPMNFADHRGYVSLFDGVSLKGWDGNPKFWRVENGAIVGESTSQNPSGNSYIAYRDVVAKDFTLKFEIKIEGAGGSGFQYRSKTGLPWLRPIPANVTANAGESRLDDDWSSGGFLAQPDLHRTVLFGKHADGDHGISRSGR